LADHRLPAFVLPSLRAEWDAISLGHRNFVLAGTPSLVDAMVAAMLPYFREPVRLFNPETDRPVPQMTDGTLILTEIGRLNASHQVQLSARLDRYDVRRPVQIVSTTSASILALVESGEFRADLYYRLNIVRIDLVEADPDRSDRGE
jgi:hypothetical protein